MILREVMRRADLFQGSSDKPNLRMRPAVDIASD